MGVFVRTTSFLGEETKPMEVSYDRFCDHPIEINTEGKLVILMTVGHAESLCKKLKWVLSQVDKPIDELL